MLGYFSIRRRKDHILFTAMKDGYCVDHSIVPSDVAAALLATLDRDAILSAERFEANLSAGLLLDAAERGLRARRPVGSCSALRALAHLCYVAIDRHDTGLIRAHTRDTALIQSLAARIAPSGGRGVVVPLASAWAEPEAAPMAAHA